MAVQIIAEAGVNHNGDIQTAQKLIEVATQAGADIVKFQTFQADKLVSKKAKKADYQIENTSDSQEDTQLQMLKKLELSKNDHYTLIEYCRKQNIQFLSTGFDLESLDFLYEINIPFFKIPSGEITNLPYLKKIASFGKEVILSTGMANLGEIEQALAVLTKYGINLSNITVLHCNTEYPTPMQDVNLKAMQSIQQAFGVKVGYSDHTMGIEVAIAAVTLGATVIEKHFTLDKNADGPDHKASLEPNELKQMILAIRNIEQALGNGIKKPSESESKNIEIARKSVHLSKNLPAGHILTEQDFIMKRPANGISPMLLEQLIGRTLIKSQEEDYQLQWTDII
jgi:N-acetylneuraminate synthase